MPSLKELCELFGLLFESCLLSVHDILLYMVERRVIGAMFVMNVSSEANSLYTYPWSYITLIILYTHTVCLLCVCVVWEIK